MENEKIDRQLPLTAHLEELRSRLIKVLIILAIFFSLCYWKSEYLFNFITEPLSKHLPPKSTLSMIKITEGFFTELKLSFMAALFFSMPFIFYQLWKFVVPGLYEHEKRYALGFVLSASLLFFGGSSFCYFAVLPVAFKFFMTYAHGDISANISLQSYLSFVLKTMLGFGLVFELPVIIFFLAKMGLVTSTMLRKHRAYSVVGIFIIAGVLTPSPDVFSQLMMAGPLLLLYEISIYIAQIFGKKKTSKEVNIYE